MKIFEWLFKREKDYEDDFNKSGFEKKLRRFEKETRTKFVRVNLKKEACSVFESKLRGIPYMPLNFEYPRDRKGNPLTFFAQINFEQMPVLENFPQKGILQFYLLDDDLTGLNFHDLTDQDKFRVIYHKDIIKDLSKLSDNMPEIKVEETYMPISNEVKMSFNYEYESLCPQDFRFHDKFMKYTGYKLFDLDDEVSEKIFQGFHGEGHKIGGYSYFTQTDPREYSEKIANHTVQLLQIDSDSSVGCMWGDCGVCNFLIKKEDLINLKFDNVAYTWDCC